MSTFRDKIKMLMGRAIKPLFDYFKGRDAFRILPNDEVSMDDGSGIVHCAPAFGEIDFEVCGREGIELVCPVDENGLFTSDVPDYTGQFVKDCDKDIIKRLKSSGHLFKQGSIRHRYPMCPRTDTPLIYKVVSTWFVKVEESRDKLLNNNNEIHWTPKHIQTGRFGKWLEQARDWNIARSRYFGTPIPLWRSADGDLLAVVVDVRVVNSNGFDISPISGRPRINRAEAVAGPIFLSKTHQA